MPAPEPGLTEQAESSESQQVETLVESDQLPEAILTLDRLPEEEQQQAIAAMQPDSAAELVEHLVDIQAAELVGRLQPEVAAAILEAMPSDRRADILFDVEESRAADIIAAMSPEEARDAKRLSRYEPRTAGGLMCTEMLSFPADSTVRDVLDDLSENADRYRDFDVQYSFVTDRRRLVGVLPMRDLVLARRSAPLTDIMIHDPISVRDDAPLEEIDAVFESHRFLGLPVVDAKGRLVGLVQRSAVEQAKANDERRDHMKSQGIVGGEEIRSFPLLVRSRRRLSWLSVNILLNIIAASVIAVFQDTLAAVIALAVFLPIISDMSGCSGNQAVAVSMRELSLGLVRVDDLLRVWLKELSVGLINGLCLGVLIGLAALLWKGDPLLGLVVGAALCLNTIVAVSIGGAVPLVVKRFGFDPAIASGPILTTVTDMCGFFLVLGMASVLLT